MRTFQLLFVSLVVLNCSSALAPPLHAGRPNIVFLYTDDQAPTALGLRNPQIETPHLDRLFQQGAELAGAFVTTPVCSPARAGVMASRYGSEVGITDWINPRQETELGLPPELVTWPELLAGAGYQTALVGKWHLGTADRYHPTRTGFESFVGFRSGGTRPKDPVLEIDGHQRNCSGFTTDLLTDHAIEFLKMRDPQRPFVLCLHFRAPHAPWLPTPEEDWSPYARLDPQIPNPDWPHLDAEKIKRMTREYYASVTGVDRNVGRVLKTLDDLKLTDDTAVIFTSDHGYNLGHNALWYKGNAQWQLTRLPQQKWPHIGPKQRPNLLDQSLRVPTAIRWPAVIKPGMVIPQTVTNLDWHPTLCEMAGVQIPQDVTIHGRSFLPLLRGEKPDWNDELYAEYSMKHGAQTHMRAWRTERWKLMIDFNNPGRVELYDLKNDPTETKNLADSKDPAVQEVRGRLEAKIMQRMKELNDPALKLTKAAQ